MLIYDKQIGNDSDLNDNYKILSYFHKDVKCFTKLNIAIFKDLGEGVVMVKPPNIYYLHEALNVLSVCVYIYIYIHTHTHTYTHTHEHIHKWMFTEGNCSE